MGRPLQPLLPPSTCPTSQRRSRPNPKIPPLRPSFPRSAWSRTNWSHRQSNLRPSRTGPRRWCAPLLPRSIWFRIRHPPTCRRRRPPPPSLPPLLRRSTSRRRPPRPVRRPELLPPRTRRPSPRLRFVESLPSLPWGCSERCAMASARRPPGWTHSTPVPRATTEWSRELLPARYWRYLRDRPFPQSLRSALVLPSWWTLRLSRRQQTAPLLSEARLGRWIREPSPSG
mmetsp:Transcript_37681/g.78926  ORF Transcript_37681/g.78926 Transcript_37681/m.78926 type:complete len:228 (-) Transcript_37681:461-1144(-)